MPLKVLSKWVILHFFDALDMIHSRFGKRFFREINAGKLAEQV
jgi:hypothetical protein